MFSFMEEHHMINAHDKVVAGISGGADSVCLLFVLLEYRKRIPFSLAVVHVNHGIRAEAGEDEAYVEELCRKYEVPFYPFHVDVRQKAKLEKSSEEEAGRIARYEAFARAAADFGANKIAVAHNCNDRSETLLFHLFRGSGIKGLTGIRPVRDNIIRPILCLERREVEAYLEEQGISYCTDATNEKDDYTRNRIRHHILSYAEEEISSGCVSHMARTADMLSDIEEYLEQQTGEAMQKCVNRVNREPAGQAPGREAEFPDAAETDAVEIDAVEMDAVEMDVAAFLANHTVICRRILYRVITELAASAKDISQVHVSDLLTLFTKEGNRTLCLPYGIRGRRSYDKVVVECKKPGDTAQDNQNAPIPVELEWGVCKIPLEDGRELEFTLLSGECNLADFPSNQYTKWFDYDKIEQSLVFRTRRTGDYLTIAGKNGQISHKSVKDYMIAEKIPKEERDQIPLVAAGDHVLWLIGYRISEYYKVSKNTKCVLQVQLRERSCDGSETEEKNG